MSWHEGNTSCQQFPNGDILCVVWRNPNHTLSQRDCFFLSLQGLRNRNTLNADKDNGWEKMESCSVTNKLVLISLKLSREMSLLGKVVLLENQGWHPCSCFAEELNTEVSFSRQTSTGMKIAILPLLCWRDKE